MENIQQIYYQPYVDEKKACQILKKLQQKKLIRNLYIIVCRKNHFNLLEVMSSSELYRLDSREKDVFIVGFAKEREQAFLIVTNLCGQVNIHFGDVNKINILKELEI